MNRTRGMLAIGLLLLLGACDNGPRYTEIIEVSPIVDPAVVANPPRTSRDRNEAMLATFQAVGDLQAMTYFGDFDQVIDFQHHQIMQQFKGSQSGSGGRRACSMFAHRTGRDTGLVGRNFDNRDTQVMVGWFYPAKGYASVALLPLADLGYSPAEPFDPAVEQHRKTLLYAPVMAIEGINEKGVTVTLASLDRRQVTPSPDRQPRFLIHLVREILDYAGSVNEAVSIAEKYNVFDNFDDGEAVISHHIFLADPHSGSAVLEWRDGSMHLVKDPGDWQVVTNSDMFEVPLADRRRRCDRYGSLAKSMGGQEGTMTWQQAMDALVDARQKNKTSIIDGQKLKISTQWSAVFDTGERSLYLALGDDYRTVYRFEIRPQAH
ncbi:MAG: hypothetical protein QNL91_07910 [Candidatus Krumholzibacteria bacterium]|nr:hypothetical protein [Candidatus Krumholzibacteria bacterium]